MTPIFRPWTWILLAGAALAFAQDAPKKPEGEEKKKVAPLKEARTKLSDKFKEILRSSEVKEGLFKLYQDKRDGKVYLAIAKDQLDREFIYFSHTLDGIVSTGHFRGYFEDSKVVTLHRRFDAVDFVAQNHSFYFDPQNALHRAAEANISPAVLATAPVVAEDAKAGVILIETDGIFLKEFFRQIKPSDPKDENADKDAFKLGNLSESRTRYTGLHNYPANTALTVEYVFEDLHPKNWPKEQDVTDPRFVSIKVQHTLIAMPQNDYQSRFDDPRVGYFMTKVTDLTSTSNTPYRDVIHRWRLVPKDPAAAISEPVEPIVWWIENTTPVELRETIKNAALTWNEAFESAGWKNAVQVNIQPDDADWDAGDIRYNVLRWSSSPDAPFGGYGPSFTNPRTGQILGADIQLEYIFLTNRVRYRKIYTGPAGDPRNPSAGCALNDQLHRDNLFGRAALKMSGLGKLEVDEMMKEALHYLVIHEIGHTLGLGHNFKASQMLDAVQIHDKAITEKRGLTASVMDYPCINVAPLGVAQGNYYTLRPGPYDHWAIQFGYSRALPDAAAEAKRLETLLARSTEPGLDYANDSDDMRSPGKAIDPRAMIGDMSSDAITYAAQRIDKVRSLLGGLLQKSPEPGRTYQTVRDERTVLMNEYKGQLGAVARYLGGVYVDRAVVGQANGRQPLTPVPLAEQKRAMQTLAKYAFAADAFPPQAALYAHLQEQRRGWDFENSGEDPKILDQILDVQKEVLNHVLHKNTVNRVLNTELYGNGYGLGLLMEELTTAVLDPAEADPNLMRQNLQRAYLEKLIAIAGLEKPSDYPQPSQALAFGQLRKFEALTNSPNAHLALLAYRVEQAKRGDR